MRKAKSFPSRELRTRRRGWLRRNRWLVALIVGGSLLIGGILILLVSRGEHWDWQSYAVGALSATLVAATVHVVNTMFLVHDQGAIRQLRGAIGEDNTRDELRSAARRRLIWDWVDSVELRAGDLDHVVITRRGGVVVIDSKWRNEVSRRDIEDMARSARRAATRAEALFASVLTAERRARHRRRANPVKVVPLVVLWGGAQSEVPEGFEIDGVRIVDGLSLRAYLRSLGGAEITRSEARDAMSALRSFRKTSVGR